MARYLKIYLEQKKKMKRETKTQQVFMPLTRLNIGVRTALPAAGQPENCVRWV